VKNYSLRINQGSVHSWTEKLALSNGIFSHCPFSPSSSSERNQRCISKSLMIKLTIEFAKLFEKDAATAIVRKTL